MGTLLSRQGQVRCLVDSDIIFACSTGGSGQDLKRRRTITDFAAESRKCGQLGASETRGACARCKKLSPPTCDFGNRDLFKYLMCIVDWRIDNILADVVSEMPRLASRLLVKNKELYGRYDRFRSEASFRAGGPAIGVCSPRPPQDEERSEDLALLASEELTNRIAPNRLGHGTGFGWVELARRRPPLHRRVAQL
jgi:hypothetical protein